MLTAITRVPSSSLPRCELSFLERDPIDVARARVQHRSYQDALREAGATVVELPPLDELPDACFVEDTAIVLDDLAILSPMGAATRRPESEAMATVLSAYRPVHWLRPPATLDGGDVLRLGHTLYVGQTPRTNPAAVDQLCRLLAPRGYSVVAVPITRCLHLKSACARVDDSTVLLNPLWIDAAVFGGATLVAVADSEPWGANALRAGNTMIFPASEPQTRATVARSGHATTAVDVSELQKAEAGVTCLSLVFDA
jgi:dimethylargininase